MRITAAIEDDEKGGMQFFVVKSFGEDSTVSGHYLRQNAEEKLYLFDKNLTTKSVSEFTYGFDYVCGVEPVGGIDFSQMSDLVTPNPLFPRKYQ